MSGEADIQALIEAAVARFGRLDCRFNNAGASVSASLDSVTEADLNGGMQLRVGSVLFDIKLAIPGARRGPVTTRRHGAQRSSIRQSERDRELSPHADRLALDDCRLQLPRERSLHR